MVDIFSIVGWITEPECSPAVARADLTEGMSLVGSQPSPIDNLLLVVNRMFEFLTYHNSLPLPEREHVENVVDRLHLPDLDVVPPQVGGR